MSRFDHLSRLLDVLESGRPISLPRLAASGGVSPMSARRAAERLRACGVLTQAKAADPITGRRCRVLSPAGGGCLAVFDLSGTSMTAWLLPCSLNVTEAMTGVTRPGACAVSAIVHEPQGDFTAEENLRILLSRVRQAIRSAAMRPDTILPALILPPDRGPSAYPAACSDPPSRLARIIRESLTGGEGLTRQGQSARESVAPVLLTGEASAAERAMVRNGWTDEAVSVLYLRAGADAQAVCFCRDDRAGSWFTPSLLRPLLDSLTARLSSPEWGTDGTCRLPADVRTGLAPDVMLLDGFTPSDGEQESGVHYLRGGIPLSVLGAAMMARRQQWEALSAAEESRKP